jgi:hypothetical protein
LNTKPVVREFTNEQEVETTVKELEARGVSQKDIYVLTHENDRTDRIANKADTNTIGVNEQGLGTSIANVFQKTGDELRNKMKEIGLSKEEASLYEEKLDQGKILLFVKDHQKAQSWL